jgi:5'-nucleotidase
MKKSQPFNKFIMKYLYFVLGVLFFSSCATTKKNSSQTKDDGILEVVLVQVNDVYEIAAIENGKTGGVARIAALKKKYLQQNPNTLLLMAGDFFSPSVYNSLQYEGKRIRGKQMVAAMNAAGFDWAVFGNHEFDISEKEAQERIDESAFNWVASNTFHKTADGVLPFAKQKKNGAVVFPEKAIISLKDADGTVVKLGLFGITLPFNKADYVSYTDPLEASKKMYAALKDSCDAVVAITHQAIADDIVLAKEIPGLTAIVGGHEHDMRREEIGPVIITKAHSNAKSAYIIRVLINKKTKKTLVRDSLYYINETVAPDSATQVVVDYWTGIANANYASIGFNAKEVIMASGPALDGRDDMVRSEETNFTQLLVKALEKASPAADIILFNGGSMRLDDFLQAPITQYDIIRTLPFGGAIKEVAIKGSLLTQVLNVGLKNKGTGGFLHSSNTALVNGVWLLKGMPIDENAIYRVALTDFLFSGKEANLGFLQPANPGVVKIYDDFKSPDVRSDIRLAFISYLKSL